MSNIFMTKRRHIATTMFILFVGLYAPNLSAKDLKVVDVLASKVWLFDDAGKKEKKVASSEIKGSVSFPFYVAEKSVIKDNLIPLPDYDGGKHRVDKRDMLVEAFKCPRGLASASGRSLATSGAGACQ